MAQVMVNFRLDEDVKKEVDEVCREIGISTSAAFNVFARKVARERRIPFDLSADPFYSTSNLNALRESRKQFEEGRVVEKSLDELLAMED